jgi:hypothetical protein
MSTRDETGSTLGWPRPLFFEGRSYPLFLKNIPWRWLWTSKPNMDQLRMITPHPSSSFLIHPSKPYLIRLTQLIYCSCSCEELKSRPAARHPARAMTTLHAWSATTRFWIRIAWAPHICRARRGHGSSGQSRAEIAISISQPPPAYVLRAVCSGYLVA